MSQKSEILREHSLVANGKGQVSVEISNSFQKKSTLSTYTAYSIKGVDAEGSFEVDRRYSDFDHVRSFMIERWPGCFVPPLPKKKIIGNTDTQFVEKRKEDLELFLVEVSQLQHLWYSKEFQYFLKSKIDLQKQLKSVPHESNQQIIKRYSETLTKLEGKAPDTMTLARVIEFNNYMKKIIPVLENFKEIAKGFINSQGKYFEQMNVLYSYILPEFQKNCLTNYTTESTEQKFIFDTQKDEKLDELVSKLKEIISDPEIPQIYRHLYRQQRELESFQETYRVRDYYESKLKELRTKEKDLLIEESKLKAGKQGLFKGLLSSIQSSKEKIKESIEKTRQDIKDYGFICDLVVLIMGDFDIPRFKKLKFAGYMTNMRKIAQFQVEYNTAREDICNYILQNKRLN